MGHKLIFMFAFLCLLSGVAFAAALSLNLVPPEVSRFVYTNFSVSSQARMPYLEKFEGHWSAVFVPNQDWSAVAKCTNAEGTLEVHNGTLSGVIGTVSASKITGTITTDGKVNGTYTMGGQNKGSFSGRVANTGGSVQWKDTVDCSGSITLQKLDPVHDPVAATVASFVDGVTLERGGTLEAPAIDASLYEGDILHLPAGASARLLVGSGFSRTPVVLVGPTTYTVPAPAQ